MPAATHPPQAPGGTSSRRTAVRHAALLAALGTLSLRLGGSAQAIPHATKPANTLLVQSFGQGSLFPTQGDVGVLPYTAILWDAAERGFLALDQAGGLAGVASTEAILAALAAAAAPPTAMLMTLAAGDNASGAMWALRLSAGELGSDPGAVTYQGAPLAGDEAPSWLGQAPPDLPDGPQDLGPGYLIVAGLSMLDPG